MTGTGLRVEAVTVRYGGLTALDNVSLEAPSAACTGLIGPNGAGKSTLINACFGMIPGATGRIALNGAILDGMTPAARARMGLSRTFQRMELFDTLTAADNVRMGFEARFVGRNILRMIRQTRRASREADQSCDFAIELCGLDEVRNTTVKELSTGHRRLVEFARALASSASMLLLDEPSSGLDRIETERFGLALHRAIAERGIGILLVEHDMSLVSFVCDRVHILDFGRKIFEGTMQEARRDAQVKAAYLGDEDIALRHVDSFDA